eukprot:XP_012813646.1 PREDICTED: coiled-coil domain-containing protein 122 [Xenopus tropicalis]
MANQVSSITDVVKQMAQQQQTKASEAEKSQTVQIQFQEEMANLEEKLKEVKQCITLKNKVYEEEKERHIELQKEIEVQKKRFDAILKRLHSQINKVKMNRRHYRWQIDQMETQAMNLRQKLETMRF